MSGAMLKQMMEEATAFLREEKYDKALDAARRVSQFNASNFPALMCVGVASFHLQLWEDAETALRRAADLKPELPAPWKNLVDLYDATSDGVKKMEALEKLIGVFRSGNKTKPSQKWMAELATTAMQLKLYGRAFDAWYTLVDETQGLSVDVEANDELPSSLVIWLTLVDLLQLPAFSLSDAKGSNVSMETLATQFATVSRRWHWTNSSTETESLRGKTDIALAMFVRHQLNHVKTATPLKAKQTELKKLDALAASVIEWFPTSKLAAEYLLLRSEDADAPIDDAMALTVAAQLGDKFPKSPMSLLFQGFALADTEPLQARDLIVEGLASCSAASFHEGSLCVRAHMALASIALSTGRDVEGCLARLQKAQATVADKTGLLGTGSPKPSVYSELKHQLLQAQAHDLAGAVDAALEAYSAVLASARESGDADALCRASVGAAELLCSKDRPSDAREVLTRATSERSGLTASQLASLHCSLAWATYLLLDMDEARSLLQDHHAALTTPAERARALKRLAIVYWHADGGTDRTDKTKCFGSLLQAAKLAPRDGEVFAWLGKWYHEIASDVVRAEKCFLKALSLAPLNEMAGVSLSTIYEQQDKTELCLSLWQDLTASPESAPTWALLRLAQHLVDRDNEDAVTKLHLVLRNEPLHAPHWVAMGHVYRHFGKPVAAQRSYVRAIELGERGWCVLTELARIEGSLHQYDDALARIQEATTEGAVDDDASRDVIATVHAELLFEQAKYFNGEGLYGRAAANVKKAAALLMADSGSKATATLKLLGDIHCFAFYLSPLDFADDSDSGWLAFLSRGRAAYEQVLTTLLAASDSPEAVAQAHYDIGMSCWYQARALYSLHGRRFNAFTLQQRDADSVDERAHQYLCDARTHLRRALALAPSFALAWNALGVVLAHPVAKQRAWTRAIQASNLDAAWANLGMLYVHHGSAELARNAFLHLQAVNTNNPAMWLGYGMLYLRQREDRKAVEAFQCALEMGNHLDALQGVVLATLVSQEKETEETEAMPVLQFAIKKYLEREAFDPLAWSLLSSVQLQLGLLAQAASSSTKSQELLGDDTHDAVAKHHKIVSAAVRISEGRDADDAFGSLHEAFVWSAAGRLVLAAQRCYATSDFAGTLHAARTALSTVTTGDQQGAVAAFALGLCALVSSNEDAQSLAETALAVVRERMASRATTIHEVDAAEAFYRATASLDKFLSLLDAYPVDGRADAVADFIAVRRGLALVDSEDPTAFASPPRGTSCCRVAEALHLSVLKSLLAAGDGSSPMKLVRAEPWNPSAYAYAALHVYASAVAHGSTGLASSLRLLEMGLRLATDGQPSVLLHWTSALVHQRLATDASQVHLHVGKGLDCLRTTELPVVDRLLWEARIHALADPVAAVAKYAEALKTATSADVVLAILYELGGVCEATGLLDTAHHVWKTVMSWKHASIAEDAVNVPGFLGNLHLAIVHATKQNAKSAKKFSKTAVTLATAGGDDSLMATTARFVESVVAKM